MVQPRTCLFLGHLDTSSSWSAWTPGWTAMIWRGLEEVSESDREVVFLSKEPMVRIKSGVIATKTVLVPLRDRIIGVILSWQLAVDVLNVDTAFEEAFMSLRGKTISAVFLHDSVQRPLSGFRFSLGVEDFLGTTDLPLSRRKCLREPRLGAVGMSSLLASLADDEHKLKKNEHRPSERRCRWRGCRKTRWWKLK
jgi:hypothetical protein